MKESLSPLAKWLDSDFWKQGAFLTSADGETIVFGKGGKTSKAQKLVTSEKPIFYLKDFYQNSYLKYEPHTYLECTREEFNEYLEEIEESSSKYRALKNDDGIYEHDFNKLNATFSSELEKVVLLSREYYQGFQGEKSIKAFLKRAFEFGTGFPYGLWDQDYGVIGSTPELLYDIDFDELKTFALAGTAKIGEKNTLLNSKKDRHEHDVVIQDIAEKLKPFVMELEVGETHLHPYKNIVHLKTDITAVVDEDVDLTKLTNLMSPTAALGGYPKANSLKFLQDSQYGQKYPLRYFGSAFGIVSEDIKEFIVSIRNVQWNKEGLYIESGGGVVAESELSQELAEIHLKRETIRKHYL